MKTTLETKQNAFAELIEHCERIPKTMFTKKGIKVFQKVLTDAVIQEKKYRELLDAAKYALTELQAINEDGEDNYNIAQSTQDTKDEAIKKLTESLKEIK